MAISWEDYTSSVNKAWVYTLKELDASQLELSRRDLQKLKVEYIGLVRSDPTKWVVGFAECFGSSTRAIAKGRSILKAAGGDPLAVTYALPPDVIHLAEWGYDAWKGQDSTDLFEWKFAPAPAKVTFYRKKGESVSIERRASFMKLMCPELKAVTCAGFYRALHEWNSFGHNTKAMQASFWDAYKLIRDAFVPGERLREKVRKLLAQTHASCVRCGDSCLDGPYCSETCAYDCCPQCKQPWTEVSGEPLMPQEVYEPNAKKHARIKLLEYQLSLRPLVEDLDGFKRSFCCRAPLLGFVGGNSCEECKDKWFLCGEASRLAQDAQKELCCYWPKKCAELERLRSTPDVPVPLGPPSRVRNICDRRPSKRRRV
jgi:hypothetical protein